MLPFDITGEWEASGEPYLQISGDGKGGLRIKSAMQRDATASEPFMDPSGCLRFSTRSSTSGYFHCLRFAEADTLLDEVLLDANYEHQVAIVILHRSSAALRAKVWLQGIESELRDNVNGLKTAELAYDAAFDAWVALPVWPRPVRDLSSAAVPFPSDDTAPPEYRLIGWRPDGDVTGTYSVDVSANGQEFTVNGWQDLDGDGVPAHWQASRTENAHRVSPEGVR